MTTATENISGLKQGIWELSYDDYAAIPAVRSSYLNALAICPANALVQREDTETLIFGRRLHTYALFGEIAFLSKYMVMPKVNRATKQGKELHKKKLIEADNKELIEQDDFDNIRWMTDSVHNHPTASQILKAGRPEMVSIWKDIETDLWCKAMIDWLPNAADGVIIDLKHCTKKGGADAHAFNATVRKYGYAVSAAHYLEGASIASGKKYDAFGFVVVEKEKPFRCEVFELDASWLNYGHNEAHRLLKVEKMCRDKYNELMENVKEEDLMAATARAQRIAYPNYVHAGAEVLIKPEWVA